MLTCVCVLLFICFHIKIAAVFGGYLKKKVINNWQATGGWAANLRQPKVPENERCEDCSANNRFIRATLFCTDCCEKLCESCSLLHRERKPKPHIVHAIPLWMLGNTTLFYSKCADYCYSTSAFAS